MAPMKSVNVSYDSFQETRDEKARKAKASHFIPVVVEKCVFAEKMPVKNKNMRVPGKVVQITKDDPHSDFCVESRNVVVFRIFDPICHFLNPNFCKIFLKFGTIIRPYQQRYQRHLFSIGTD
jgi:hypothetical protein